MQNNPNCATLIHNYALYTITTVITWYLLCKNTMLYYSIHIDKYISDLVISVYTNYIIRISIIPFYYLTIAIINHNPLIHIVHYLLLRISYCYMIHCISYYGTQINCAQSIISCCYWYDIKLHAIKYDAIISRSIQ